ncbi:MAG TPA: hypothetical protein VKA32_10405, partial [Gammaproteobacteria bacterium]|nr:hypothetical protein [Gammaproteobacteria bacterium]
MPFVHIRSLPFDPPLDVPAIVRRVNCDLSDVLGIPADHITVTWELVAPGHYSVGGRTEYTQPP